MIILSGKVESFLDNKRLTKKERNVQEIFCKKVIASIREGIEQGNTIVWKMGRYHLKDVFKEDVKLCAEFLYHVYEVSKKHDGDTIQCLKRSASRGAKNDN